MKNAVVNADIVNWRIRVTQSTHHWHSVRPYSFTNLINDWEKWHGEYTDNVIIAGWESVECLPDLHIFGHTPIIRSLSHWLIVCFLMLTFTKFQWRFIQKLYRWWTLKRIIDGPNIFLYPRTGWRNVWVTPWKALKISLKSKLSH